MLLLLYATMSLHMSYSLVLACSCCFEASVWLQGKLEECLHAGIMQTVMFDAHGNPTLRDHLGLDVFAYAGRSDSVFHQTCIRH